MVQNISKLAHNCPKELKNSNMVQNGLNLSRKSSKWVRHNHVSWSSLHSRYVNECEVALLNRQLKLRLWFYYWYFHWKVSKSVGYSWVCLCHKNSGSFQIYLDYTKWIHFPALLQSKGSIHVMLAVLGKPSREKNLLLFGISPNDLDPPPLFFNPLRNFFLNLILYKLKFLKMFVFVSSSSIFLWKRQN